MAITNPLNKASDIFIVGPIGTVQYTSSLITARKDQSTATQVAVVNETDNANAQSVYAVVQNMHNAGSPALASGALQFYHDQYAGVSAVAGYLVVQNDISGGAEPGKGIYIWGSQTTDNVVISTGATATTRILVNSNGGKYQGQNAAHVAGAGNIGEIMTANVAQGSPVSLPINGAVTDIATINLTGGNWLIFVIAGFTGAPTTGTSLHTSVNTASGTLGTLGVNHVSGTSMPTSTNDVFLNIAAYPVSLGISGQQFWFSSSANAGGGSVAGYGTVFGVRVG